MAKTKPIGVRFDEDLLNKFKKMGYTSPQRVLNFLEQWYLNNIEKVVAFNQANSHAIEKERNYENNLKSSINWTEFESQKEAYDSGKINRTIQDEHGLWAEPKNEEKPPEKKQGESSIDFRIRYGEWRDKKDKK